MVCCVGLHFTYLDTGIGNIWRFPYVIANNGGAAALFAYLVCAVLVSVPLFLYELIIGQNVRLSTIRCYEAIRPRWKSLGYASATMLFMVLVSCFTDVEVWRTSLDEVMLKQNGFVNKLWFFLFLQSYYAQVVAYTLPYIIESCKDPLPWVEKGAEDHWKFGVLNAYADGEERSGLGGIVPRLAISLFCFWIICLLTASFGSDILFKLTYVTVYRPVILMLILVIRSPFLEGAGDGIDFYIGKFEVSKLADLTVWATACSQILFSLSPGFGTAITYSS
jgi:neurotransmitter:Na+ symporter, NSS family